MADEFIWATATPSARADMVRCHRVFLLTETCRLFCLTEEGARSIQDGAETFPAAIAERIFGGEQPLRVFRNHRSLTQAELAGRAGVGQNVISRIESGKMTGTVGTLAALAKALAVTVDDLID